MSIVWGTVGIIFLITGLTGFLIKSKIIKSETFPSELEKIDYSIYGMYLMLGFLTLWFCL